MALAVKNDLIDKYRDMLSNSMETPTKRKRNGKRRGSGSRDKDAVQLVCELLVFEVPPSVIPGTIVLM